VYEKACACVCPGVGAPGRGLVHRTTERCCNMQRGPQLGPQNSWLGMVWGVSGWCPTVAGVVAML
jgi:hypothetical protein